MLLKHRILPEAFKLGRIGCVFLVVTILTGTVFFSAQMVHAADSINSSDHWKEGSKMSAPASGRSGTYDFEKSHGEVNDVPLDTSDEKPLFPTGKAVVAADSLPPCYQASPVYAVTVEGKNIPVTGYQNNDDTEYYYAHFSFSGIAQVRITAIDDITSYNIKPESYDLEGSVHGRNLTFELTGSRYLLININDMKNLVIIADPLEEDIPASKGEGIYNIDHPPYSADKTGSENATAVLQSAIDAANSAGGGIVYIPNGVYRISSVTIRSNVHIYMEGGAVLQGTGVPTNYRKENPASNSQSITTFIHFAEDASNMRIYGRGTLDANGEVLYDNGGSKDPDALRICGLRPNKNSGIVIDGIIVSHGRTWTVVPQQSDHVVIQNVKVLNSTARNENDGIDINSCQDVLVKHCFTYTNDDSLCVKACNAGSFKGMITGPEEDACNITFDDIVTYGRCAGAKMGMQGLTSSRNICFKNIEVLQGSRGIAIQHDQGTAVMENIRFSNINVESLAYRTYKPYPIQMRIKKGGKVKNVEVSNVTFQTFGDGSDSPDGYNGENSVIAGQNETSRIENVRFNNLKIAGKTIRDSSSAHMDINDFTSGIVFATTS